VANQSFGHWKPLKIRDLESCKNFQGGKKDLGKIIVLLNNICEEAR
jgi:hypothetical protein